MSQFFTDFSEYTTSVIPSDWTRYWNTTPTGPTVEDDGTYEGGKYLQHYESSSFVRSALAWENVSFPSDTEVELYFKMDIRTQGIPLPSLRASGTAESARTGYVFLCRNDTNIIDIRRAVSGTETSLGTQAFTFTDNTIYHFRCKVSGTGATVTIQIRVWADGGSEPGTWTQEVTDTNASRIVSAGRVQLGNVGNGNTYGKIDVVGVGFSDVAPTSGATPSTISEITSIGGIISITI